MATRDSEIPQALDLNLRSELSPKELPTKNDQLSTKVESPLSPEVLNVRVESVQPPKESTMASNAFSLLHHAALVGNWKDAKALLKKHSSLKTAIIAPWSMTALHVAAFKGHSEFVKNMVAILPKEALEMRDDRLGTVLNYVAFNGSRSSLEVAKALISKNRNLLDNLDDNSDDYDYDYDHDYNYDYDCEDHDYDYDCEDHDDGGDDDDDFAVSYKERKEKRFGALYYAIRGSDFGNTSKGLARYLASETKNGKVLTKGLVMILLAKGYPDILLELLKRFPEYLDKSNAIDLLYRLAGNPSNFKSGSSFEFWQRFIYSILPVSPNESSHQHSERSNNEDPHEGYQQLLRRICPISVQHACDQATSWIKRLHYAKLRHHCEVELVTVVCKKIITLDAVKECFTKQPQILTRAVKSGNIEVLRTCFHLCPQLIWIRLWNGENFLQAAIRYRRDKIFKFLAEEKTCFAIECYRDIHADIDVLHKIVKLPPFQELSCVSGAALQMQREMQWFKAVEKLVPPNLLNKKKEDITALESFKKEHEKLAETGEKWMKDTSNSCMIVSTLITTVVFAAAFTVPGGNNNSDGLPVLLWTDAFLVFAVSNTLALFASVTSLLMFLSILTARYALDDFLYSLPNKLIIGLASLFVAIATMIIAFGAALTILLGKRLEWVSIPIVLSASFIPVSIFGLLQLPLFLQMVKSTYFSNIIV